MIVLTVALGRMLMVLIAKYMRRLVRLVVLNMVLNRWLVLGTITRKKIVVYVAEVLFFFVFLFFDGN